MSVTRAPLHNDTLRRREEIADAQKTAVLIGGLMLLVACAFVWWITWGMR